MKDKFIFEETKGSPIKHWTKGVLLDDKARQQLHNIATLPFIHKHVAVMPDVHFGMGATIGSVIATKGAIVPAAVGVDIGCLDSETEFLSPAGWIKLSEYRSEEVLQYDLSNDVASFITPQKYIKKPCKDFYHLKSSYGLDQMLSPDHKILFMRGSKGRGYVAEDVLAEDFVTHHNSLTKGISGGFKTTFKYYTELSLPLSEELIRIHVMIAADGCIRHRKTVSDKIELHLRKDRKISRAFKLLKSENIPYKITNGVDGTTTITFESPVNSKSLYIFWGASTQQLRWFCDELKYWDSDTMTGTFSTAFSDDADVVQFAHAALGERWNIFKVDYPDKKNWKSTYSVYRTKNNIVGMSTKKHSGDIELVEASDGHSYCFTVPTGYFVARRNGKIFVTGNCGMMAYQTSLNARDLPDNLRALRDDIEMNIPHGRTDNGGKNDKGSFNSDSLTPSNEIRWQSLNKRYWRILDKHPKAKAFNTYQHMGTLGTGNHFIEICLDEFDCVWVMLHSGSRGVGNKIGMYFIEKAKKEMERWHIDKYLVDKDLSYLVENTELFDDYIEAVQWAQDFALKNRESMMETVLSVLKKHVKPFSITEMAVNCHHNYISKENHFGSNVWVTRKGAVRARVNDLGIIPGSMGTGSFIVRGLGNKHSFCSCSHGAGRVMSRGQAKKEISLDQHAKAMKGIEARLDADVLDESPAAYKDINSVMDAQSDLIEVLFRLRQVVNVKG